MYATSLKPEDSPNWLIDSLPPETNWSELQQQLEARLQTGPADLVMTIQERRLLAGLRLRERSLQSPLYVQAEKEHSKFWVALIMGAGALLAS